MHSNLSLQFRVPVRRSHLMSEALTAFCVIFCQHHHSSFISCYVPDAFWELEESFWKLTTLIHDKGLENTYILGRLFHIFCLG